MQSIRQTQALNKAELENCTPPSASWHRDYSDTAFIFIGGLDSQLSEGDVITIFSQYGEPVFLNLVRDKETGRSKGFAFLKYEDQRSCDLAVDNLGGASVLGRLLNVDHTRYKRKDDEVVRDNTWDFGHERPKEREQRKDEGRRQVRDDDTDVEDEMQVQRERSRERRPRSHKLLKEEEELQEMLKDEENDDPMRAYFIEKKKEEVEKARKKHSDRSSRHHEGRHRDDDSRDKDRERRRRRDHDGSSRDQDSSRRYRARSRERRRRSRSP